VTVQPLDQRSRFILIASDGLWENLNESELTAVMQEALVTSDLAVDMIPARLIKMALERAADRHNIGIVEMLNLPASERRHFHDDITVVLVYLPFVFDTERDGRSVQRHFRGGGSVHGSVSGSGHEREVTGPVLNSPLAQSLPPGAATHSLSGDNENIEATGVRNLSASYPYGARVYRSCAVSGGSPHGSPHGSRRSTFDDPTGLQQTHRRSSQSLNAGTIGSPGSSQGRFSRSVEPVPPSLASEEPPPPHRMQPTKLELSSVHGDP